MSSQYLHVVIRGLPQDATVDAVIAHILNLIDTNPRVYNIVLERHSPTCSTTACFQLQTNDHIGPEDILRVLNNSNFLARPYPLLLDRHFYGLTTLVDQPHSVLDFCFVHGLGGHAFRSWTANDSFPYMWPRDFLPKRFDEEHIKARFLIYGHNSNVFQKANPQATITSAAQELLSHFIADRSNSPDRPIYFVCHSLGGLIVCEALVNCLCVDEDYRLKGEYAKLFTKSGECLVKGIVFFGTPFRGSQQANYAYPFIRLVAEQCLWPVNKDLVKSLKHKSIALNQIVPRFDRIRKAHGIQLLICYETQPIVGTSLTTGRDSALAVFDSDVAPIQINTDHTNMIRFSHRGNTTYSTIESRIVNMVSSHLRSTDDEEYGFISRRSTGQYHHPGDLSDELGIPQMGFQSPPLSSRMSFQPSSTQQRRQTGSSMSNVRTATRSAALSRHDTGSSESQTTVNQEFDPLRDFPLIDREKFRILENFDIVFVIDDSGSMQKNTNSKNDQSIDRWSSMQRGLKTFATIAAVFDKDGIDIYLLKSKKVKKGITDAKDVQKLLKKVNLADPTSAGGTKFREQLEQIIEPRIAELLDYKEKSRQEPYNNHRHPKPLNLIVVTDGEADDEEQLERYLVETAKRLENLGAPRNYVGVQFVQVGDDVEAAAYLQRLDDDLKQVYKNDAGQPIWDIVDTSRYMYETDEGDKDTDFERILIGAVDELLDNRGSVGTAAGQLSLDDSDSS